MFKKLSAEIRSLSVPSAGTTVSLTGFCIAASAICAVVIAAFDGVVTEIISLIA